MTDKELVEKVAKLAYQYANLVDDKEIDKRWYELANREKWFYFAEEAIPIIRKSIEEELIEQYEADARNLTDGFAIAQQAAIREAKTQERESIEAERLNRPELRKEIGDILECFGTRMKEICDEQPYLMMLIAKSCEARKEALTKILALIPAEEEIRRAVAEEIKNMELPVNPHPLSIWEGKTASYIDGKHMGYRQAQQDMLKAIIDKLDSKSEKGIEERRKSYGSHKEADSTSG